VVRTVDGQERRQERPLQHPQLFQIRQSSTLGADQNTVEDVEIGGHLGTIVRIH